MQSTVCSVTSYFLFCPTIPYLDVLCLHRCVLRVDEVLLVHNDAVLVTESRQQCIFTISVLEPKEKKYSKKYYVTKRTLAMISFPHRRQSVGRVAYPVGAN